MIKVKFFRLLTYFILCGKIILKCISARSLSNENNSRLRFAKKKRTYEADFR